MARILFLGSGSFALPTLKRLVEGGAHEILLWTLQDPASRKHGRSPLPPVLEWARASGFPLEQPEKPGEPAWLKKARAWKPDIGLVIDYGKKLPQELIEVPARRIWNLHPSLLPKYRGAAPVPWTILSGDAVSGVTLFEVGPRMDAGPIGAQEETSVGARETAPELLARLAAKGADLVERTLPDLGAGRIEPRPQDDSKATLAPKLSKEQGRIDWARSAVEIDRQVRGLAPWPGAHTSWTHPKRGTTLLRLERTLPTSIPADRPAGTVRILDGKSLHVAARDLWLGVERLLPEGKRSMSAEEFLRGAPMADGDLLASG